MQTEIKTIQVPLPQLAAPEQVGLTIKIRLKGRDKHQFLALSEFYGVSERRLALFAVRHFLHSLPKVDVL